MEKDENYLPKKVKMMVEVEIDVAVKVRPPRHPDMNTAIDVSTKAFKGMSVSGAAEPNSLDDVTHELLARLCEKVALSVNKAVCRSPEPTPVPDEPFDLSPLRPFTRSTYAVATARPWSLIEPTQAAADPIILPYSSEDLARDRQRRTLIAEAAERSVYELRRQEEIARVLRQTAGATTAAEVRVVSANTPEGEEFMRLEAARNTAQDIAAARERYMQALDEAAARRQTQAATELEAAGNEGEDNGADLDLDGEPPF